MLDSLKMGILDKFVYLCLLGELPPPFSEISYLGIFSSYLSSLENSFGLESLLRYYELSLPLYGHNVIKEYRYIQRR